MPQSTPLTPTSFVEFVRVHKFAMVHFWAIWNGHDVEMNEFIESQIPDDLANRVALAIFNVDPPEHHELCRQHQLLNLPFLEFYRDGSLVRTSIGLLAPAAVIQYLKEPVEDVG